MAGSELLTREAVLAAPDLTTRRVEVPEWGGAVMVKALKLEEVAAWQKACQKRVREPNGGIRVEPNDKVNSLALLIVAACVDTTGAQMFTAADVAALTQKSSAATERVGEQIMLLSRIGKSDVKELDDEEEEKN
jgi:hypothetical protein